MELRQLAAHGGAALRSEGCGEVVERRGEALGRLEEDERARLGGKGCERLPPLPLLARHEALEREPVGRQARDRERHEHRGRPRERGDGHPPRRGLRNEGVARIAHGRHPRVAEHQHVLPRCDPDELCGALLLVVVVERDEPGPVRDPERGEEPLGRARILCGDDRGVLERLHETPRGIPEIADRRGREDDHRPAYEPPPPGAGRAGRAGSRLVPVSTTAETLLPDARPSRYDLWMAGIRADPRRSRLLGILAPLVVTLLAAVLRLWNVGDPHQLVFDETYYVKDAWSQWLLGFPANWPADATPASRRRHEHLPRHRQLRRAPAAGQVAHRRRMWLFGADSSVAWRIAAALAGTATVLVLYFLARTLTRSTVFATVAAFLLAIDGLAIVTSRVALLDIFLTFFVVLAFWFVLLDRDGHLARLSAAFSPDAATASAGGPVLWRRPWLSRREPRPGRPRPSSGRGRSCSPASAYTSSWTDALARRRLGLRFWPTGGLRQGLAAFVLLVPAAFVVYLSSWTGWLVTEGGYDRMAAVSSPATGFWSWVPLPLQSLWQYHEAMYRFHSTLTSPHAYASPAWQWPLLVRPTSMYWHQSGDTVEAISSIPNPLIWWGGVAAAIFLAYRFIRTRNAAYAFVLTGIAATYLPWPFLPRAHDVQFYTVVILPFLVLALTFALREIAGAPDAGAARRANGPTGRRGRAGGRRRALRVLVPRVDRDARAVRVLAPAQLVPQLDLTRAGGRWSRAAGARPGPGRHPRHELRLSRCPAPPAPANSPGLRRAHARTA